MRALLRTAAVAGLLAGCADAGIEGAGGIADARFDASEGAADAGVGAVDGGAGDAGGAASAHDGGAGAETPDGVADAGGADAAGPVATAWQAGGILGSYTALGDDGAPLWEMTRLDDAVGGSWGDPVLTDPAGGGPYDARWEGGWLVDQPGPWSLRAIAGGGVVVAVDGVPLVSHVTPGAIVVEDAVVDLSAGWHALHVSWRYDPGSPLLRLWWTPPGGEARAITVGELGWPEAPPEGPAILGVDVVDVGPFSARLAVRTTTPALAAVQVAGPAGLVEAASPPASWSSRTVLEVPLSKDAAWAVVATAVDLWGREAAPAHAAFGTPGDGVWEPGALLGRYYSGMSFDDLTLERLDPGVTFPAQADGDAGGSFEAPMAADQFSVRWEGALHVPEAGTWTLWFGTDDGQRVFVDGALVAADWRDHGTSWVSATGTLAEGWHPVGLEMYENGGAAVALLEWEGPGTPRGPVPADALGTPPPVDDGAAPVLSEVIAEAAGPSRVRLVWHATELVSATLVAPGPVDTVPLGPPATGGARVVDGLPEGLQELTVEAVDQAGTAAAPVVVSVIVEPPPPPEPDGAPQEAPP